MAASNLTDSDAATVQDYEGDHKLPDPSVPPEKQAKPPKHTFTGPVTRYLRIGPATHACEFSSGVECGGVIEHKAADSHAMRRC